MNEQLQTELAAWLGKLREAADAGASFALEQAPLIVQERVAYGRILHTVAVTAGAAIIAASLFFIWRALKRAADDNPTDYVPAALGGIASVLVAPFMVFDHFGPMVQAWFAPRLYVLEWLAGLLR